MVGNAAHPDVANGRAERYLDKRVDATGVNSCRGRNVRSGQKQLLVLFCSHFASHTFEYDQAPPK